MNLRDTALADRGIAAAAEAMHWRVEGNAWHYPVPHLQMVPLWVDGVLREKGFPGAQVKYRWHGKVTPLYYAHNYRLQQAIAEADGVLHLVNGEPAVLACHTAGIYNALSLFGETSIPAGIGKHFRMMGARSVFIYPDRDETGTRAAQKIADALGKYVPAMARALPDHLCDGADINDALLDLSAAGLRYHMAHINGYFSRPLPLVPALVRKYVARRPVKQDYDKDWAAKDKDACDRMGWRPRKRFACPFTRHDDDERNPAARLFLNRSGRIEVYCHKCKQAASATDAATI